MRWVDVSSWRWSRCCRQCSNRQPDFYNWSRTQSRSAARPPTDYAGHRLSDDDDHVVSGLRDCDGVASQVVRQLADPRLKDAGVTKNLGQYKGLVEKWGAWPRDVPACQQLAALIVAVAEP